jgi:hypothetical protein
MRDTGPVGECHSGCEPVGFARELQCASSLRDTFDGQKRKIGATTAASAFNGNITNNGTINSALTVASGKTLTNNGGITGNVGVTGTGR